MRIIDALAKIYLFQTLSSQQLEELVAIVSVKSYRRGTAIFSEGAEGTGFYVLTKGKVKIYKLSPEGREQILHIFTPGEPFGEVPVFAGENYPAYAKTLTDSEALFFPRADFLRLITRNPTLALTMLAILSRRLRNFSHLIEDLSLKEVPGRLAAYLIYGRWDETSLEVGIDISKNQLASLLGTIPETLSRILTKMSKSGFIKQTGHRQIRILDYQGLEELASGERRLV